MQTATRKYALTVSAFVKNPQQVFADVRAHGKNFSWKMTVRHSWFKPQRNTKKS